MFLFSMTRYCSDVDILVLHPYFKLAYIKMAWGGAEEQEEERRKGNRDAKNWQDEAQQLLEKTVCSANPRFCLTNLVLDGTILEGPAPNHTSHSANE
jgi:hypothetical protein